MRRATAAQVARALARAGVPRTAGGVPAYIEWGVVQEVNAPVAGVSMSSLDVTLAGDPGEDPFTGASTVASGVLYSDALTPSAGDLVMMLREGRTLFAVLSLQP